MMRVSKQNPCSICKSDHWCLIGKTVCICMRVTSDRPKNFAGGEVGWVHQLDGSAPKVPYTPLSERQVNINVPEIMQQCKDRTSRQSLEELSEKLGVTVASLIILGFAVYNPPETWAIPMVDGLGHYIGIRIRCEGGKKWAVPGSHSGLFVPRIRMQRLAMVVEGPTDAAAALSLGFFPIGRPSCCGGVPHIIKTVQRLGIERVVIVADNDDAGIRGAETLREHMTVPSCILVPPAKDLREAVKSGVDKSTIDSMIEQLVWTQPKDKQ